MNFRESRYIVYVFGNVPALLSFFVWRIKCSYKNMIYNTVVIRNIERRRKYSEGGQSTVVQHSKDIKRTTLVSRVARAIANTGTSGKVRAFASNTRCGIHNLLVYFILTQVNTDARWCRRFVTLTRVVAILTKSCLQTCVSSCGFLNMLRISAISPNRRFDTVPVLQSRRYRGCGYDQNLKMFGF